MGELIYRSASSLARAIREKKASSVEVVEAHLRRIEQVNPKLNAVVQLRAEEALAEARAADKALSRGKLSGPLHGVPVTIKDAIETAGIITTGGTKGMASHVPEKDATVVARLKAAGAIVLGKTNVPEFSLVGESANLVYGRTNNPYDLSRTPGGSSGGEAAIIAAGGSPLGLGSDAGGSVRIPAHNCGIAAIYPTSGRVPMTGHWPRYDGAFTLPTQIGPMARHVEDLALALSIISGPDWRDAHVVPMPLGDYRSVKLRGLRVAYFTDNGLSTTRKDIASAVESAAKALGGAGCKVEQTRRPHGFERAGELWFGLLTLDGGAGLRQVLRETGSGRPHPFTQMILNIQRAAKMSRAETGALLVDIDRFRGAMLSYIEPYDAVVSPAHGVPAPLHNFTLKSDYTPAFAFAFNLAGWPSAVVRCGTSDEGLPIGVQVAAKPWREDAALAAVALLEKEFGGWVKPPLWRQAGSQP